MNIEKTNVKQTNENSAVKTQTNNTTNSKQESSSVNFSDELKEIDKKDKKENVDVNVNVNVEKDFVEDKEKTMNKDLALKDENQVLLIQNNGNKNAGQIYKNSLEDLKIINNELKEVNLVDKFGVKEIEKEKTFDKNNALEVDKALKGLNSIVMELNQTDEKSIEKLKVLENLDDTDNMINNEFNITENKEILPQMSPNMNFSGDGQPFSSFMGEEQNSAQDKVLASTQLELEEEKAILSTMEENIAIANKNILLNVKDTEKNVENEKVKTVEIVEELQPVKEKIVTRNDGIKKIDVKTGIVTENVVKFNEIVMSKADVEVFANLVDNKNVNLNDLSGDSVQKSLQISKTLAEMLSKCKENSQPLRIDFDNNISVIIRISRDGKISAEFLPSSQIAEAYLKESLPLLRQRFDEQGIQYEDLSQRERKNSQKEQQKKKGRNDE